MTTVAAHPKLEWLLSVPLLLVVGSVWACLHWLHGDILIFHDSWLHNFPKIYAVSRSSACNQFGHWLMWPDTGAPTLIYALSSSLAQPVRLALIDFLACTRPSPQAAMIFYKLHIYVLYLVLALGMFSLGRVLFRHWLTPVYLAAATLFAGWCLDAAHSDQVAVIGFWFPWLVLAWTLADRHAGTVKGAIYVNAAALFFCVALLDQYPHFAALTAGLGLVLYALLRFDRLRLLIGRWRLLSPVILLLAIAIAQLAIFQVRIVEYVPSLRAGIAVEPSQFGETGFVQLSAIFGLFLPLTFTAAFEAIASGYGPFGSRGFIYQLDILILYFGTIPLLLILFWFARAGQREQKIGWLAFTVLIFMVSLQQSHLYLLLFHLPFFNVFRSYFLYIVYVAAGVLLMSAFGFDRLMTASASERSERARTVLRLGGAIFATAALALGITTVAGRGLGTGIFSYAGPFAADLLTIGVAFSVFRWTGLAPRLGPRHGITVIAALVITQGLYAAGIYRILGVTDRVGFERYELSASLLRPFSSEELARPFYLRREECPTFGSCYLALRDAVSLRRDLDGTFLRHRLNPVFQKTLSPAATSALNGVTHPFLWPSAGFRTALSIDTLTDALNADTTDDIDALLIGQTYLVGYQFVTLPSQTSLPRVILSDLSRQADQISFQYRAEKAAVINVGVTYDRHWRVRLNGAEIPFLSGNFNNISFFAPVGVGKIDLSFHDRTSEFFFWSRWAEAALASAAALFFASTGWLRRATA